VYEAQGSSRTHGSTTSVTQRSTTVLILSISLSENRTTENRATLCNSNVASLHHKAQLIIICGEGYNFSLDWKPNCFCFISVHSNENF